MFKLGIARNIGALPLRQRYSTIKPILFSLSVPTKSELGNGCDGLESANIIGKSETADLKASKFPSIPSGAIIAPSTFIDRNLFTACSS